MLGVIPQAIVKQIGIHKKKKMVHKAAHVETKLSSTIK